jgi:hypothetical protein
MAGRKREPVVGSVVEHLGLAGVDDVSAVDVVAEPALGSGDEDGVTRVELVELAEGGAVGRAVAGDGGVAGPAGHRRVGVVAGPPLEVLGAHALDDVLLHRDLGDLDEGGGIAEHRWCGRRRRCGGVGRRRRGGGELGELLLEGSLVAGLGQVGAPELVADEEEQEHADRDERLADAPDDPPDGIAPRPRLLPLEATRAAPPPVGPLSPRGRPPAAPRRAAAPSAWTFL